MRVCVGSRKYKLAVRNHTCNVLSPHGVCVRDIVRAPAVTVLYSDRLRKLPLARARGGPDRQRILQMVDLISPLESLPSRKRVSRKFFSHRAVLTINRPVAHRRAI